MVYNGRTPAVTLEQLLPPTYAATRTAASAHDLVLLVGDTTVLDDGHHPTTTVLGRVGDGRGHGFLAHSVPAVLQDSRQVLGLAYQGVHCLSPVRPQEAVETA